MDTLTEDLRRVAENRQNCTWPRLYYGVVDWLLKKASATTMVEIGVAYGYHARHLLDRFPTLRYFGIDPYVSGYDPEDCLPSDVAKLFDDSNPDDAMTRLEKAVRAGLRDYGDRATLMRKTSALASLDFADHSVDLVFIDGDHTYAGALSDCENWVSKIRPGGILCGDDWLMKAVASAVGDFARKRDFRVQFIGLKSSKCPIWFVDL